MKNYKGQKLVTWCRERMNLRFSWILIAFAVIALVLGLICYGNVLAFLLMFDGIVSRLATTFQLDIFLARALAIVFGVVFVLFVSPLVFSLRAKKRRAGILITATVFFWIFTAAYWVNEDTVFNPDGSARKCMAWNPEKGEWDDNVPCGWKVHPDYGTKVFPASQEMVVMKNTIENGPGTFKRVTPDRNMRFFAPDGSPLLWYYKDDKGRYEILYGNEHPQHPGKALPVDEKTADLILKYLEEGRHDMIITDRPIFSRKSTGASVEGMNALEELRSTLIGLKGEAK